MYDFSNLPRPVIRYGVGLWRRRWVIAGVAWALALGLWFLIWLLPDKYEARAQVYVQTETVLDPVMNGVTARPNYERRVEVMRNQLLTRPNVEKVIYRSGLDSLIEGDTPIARAAALEGLTNWVSNTIDIESPQEMYFVIRYRFGDPVISRNVVDELVNLLIEQDLGAGLTESQEARTRLDSQIASYLVRLDERQRAINDFRRLHADELSVIESRERRREQLSSDLSRTAERLSLADQQVAALRTALSTTPRRTSGDELDQLRVRLASLRSQYNESHPDIQMTQARIEELTSGSANSLPENPEYRRINLDLRAAEGAAKGLAERFAALQAEEESLAFTMGQAPAVMSNLLRLQRDFEQTRSNYEDLTNRRERLSLTENLSAGGKGVEYHVYERPQTPIRPVSPPRLVFILAAVVMAFGGGAAMALLLTFLGKSFSQTSELQELYGLPVLGGLSEVTTAAVARRRVRDYTAFSGAVVGLLAMAGAYVYIEVFRLPSALPNVAAATQGQDGAQSATNQDIGTRLRDGDGEDVRKWD